MAFSTDIQKEKIEKIGMIVLTPRKRITGWSLYAANIYSVPFSLGIPVRLYDQFQRVSGTFRYKHYERVSSLSALAAAGDFHYDNDTQTLYVYTDDGDPDARAPLPTDDYPGLTVEFEIHLATRPVYGRRDPLDGTFSDVVDWRPVIASAPLANNGTSVDLFGFQPINLSTIEIANDGWMNELLYDVSWRQAGVKAFMLVGNDYEKAIQSLGVVQIFAGFVDSISETGRIVSVNCADYSRRLDDPVSLPLKFNTTDFPNVDPAAVKANEEWYVRRIIGAVDAVEPVNVDYNATPGTTVNRDFITHLDEGTQGDVTVTVDHTAPNTPTRTYFTTPPPFNTYDCIVLTHSGTPFRVPVGAVNRALQYIDHPAIGGRTIIAGDTGFRSYIGAVWVIDRNGNIYDLDSGDEFVAFSLGGALGFSLKDNVEASWLVTPFDPSQDRVYVRVYGRKDLPQYDDATDIGALSAASGVAAEGVSMIAQVLYDAGFSDAEIDKDSFSSVGSGSHTLGIAIPAQRANSPQTYKDVLGELLLSEIWKLGLTIDFSTGKMKMGLAALQPFPAPYDYQIDKTEIADLSWEQDYADIYSRIRSRFKIADATSFPVEGFQLETLSAVADSKIAAHVHGVNQTYDVNLRLFDEDEAQEITDRFSFIMGDRRAKYSMKLPFTQLINARVGVNYQVTRDHLPGFAYAFEAENQRTLNLLEVQKDLSNATLILDDQKGIQDNSGDW